MLTDSTDDTEMFDHSLDDDKDEESQLKKGDAATTSSDSTRAEREDTPGPQSAAEKEHSKLENISQSPEAGIKGVAGKE